MATKEPKKRTVNAVNAAPGQTEPNQGEQGQNNIGGFITDVLSLLCGAMCKNTPLAEFIPPPSKDNPLQSVFSGRFGLKLEIEMLHDFHNLNTTQICYYCMLTLYYYTFGLLMHALPINKTYLNVNSLFSKS